MIRVTIWNEFRHEQIEPVKSVYPRGIHSAIAGGIAAEDLEIRCATLDEPEHGLTDALLNTTDVLLWWGHRAHSAVSDEVVAKVRTRVLRGMGLIVLHSGHNSKIFSAMLGEVITVDELKDGSYVEKMRPISAADWITPDSPPTVVAYGTHDRIQPFKASLRLKAALEENEVDHVYLELPHSGHGLQNDNAIQKQWMEAIVDYLDKYMPVK